MAEIIEFPIKNLDNRLTKLNEACAAFDKFLDELKKDRIVGLYLLQCGQYAKGAKTMLPAEVVATFICQLLEDPDTRYLVNLKLKVIDESRNKED